jgi:hypothetical protein
VNFARKMRLDPADQARSFIDQAGVELEECGSGFNLCQCRLGTVDAADADERYLAFCLAIDACQHCGGALEDGSPG